MPTLLRRGERNLDRRTKKELLDRLERDALQICARFRLEYRVLEAERANVKRRYGVCYSDGTIRVRLRHATSGKPLKYSSLVNTLCHELAHLKHFNHGQRFQTFYGEILEWARRERIYRPGLVQKPAAPASLAAQGPPAQVASLVAANRTTTAQPKPRLADQLELFG
jgi:hypothetical protein